MAKFAVYFVPEETSEFYQLASKVVGYDVRAQSDCMPPRELEQQFTPWMTEWGTLSRPYGLHLTIGDAITFDPKQVENIATELESLLACFGPDDVFELTQCAELIPDWGKSIVLRYDASPALLMFHALVIARLNTLGSGSLYTPPYISPELRYQDAPVKLKQIQKFHSPTVLGHFQPHFTLLNPFTGNQKQELVETLTHLFAPFNSISVSSICLLIQSQDDKPWQIYREYSCLN